MDEQPISVEAKLTELSGKVDNMYASLEKMRKYFLWTFIITATTILLPLLVIPFVLPLFLSSLALPSGF